MKLLETLKQLVKDTLQKDGKWKFKKIAGISGFYASIVYMFVALIFGFTVNPTIFIALLTFSGATIGMDNWSK